MSKTKANRKRARSPLTEPLQTVLIYVGWVSCYTCPFNPGISWASALSILSGSSFISLSRGLHSPLRALHTQHIDRAWDWRLVRGKYIVWGEFCTCWHNIESILFNWIKSPVFGDMLEWFKCLKSVAVFTEICISVVHSSFICNCNLNKSLNISRLMIKCKQMFFSSLLFSTLCYRLTTCLILWCCRWMQVAFWPLGGDIHSVKW